MSCELCGGGDMWIKTCITPSGSRVLVCDLCYEDYASELTIVPGDWVVTMGARDPSLGDFARKLFQAIQARSS